jgi:hypothetical protein
MDGRSLTNTVMNLWILIRYGYFLRQLGGYQLLKAEFNPDVSFRLGCSQRYGQRMLQSPVTEITTAVTALKPSNCICKHCPANSCFTYHAYPNLQV